MPVTMEELEDVRRAPSRQPAALVRSIVDELLAYRSNEGRVQGAILDYLKDTAEGFQVSRLRGIAYRADNRADEDCSGWELPEGVCPVTVNFSGVPVGYAALTRDEGGNIVADAQIVAPWRHDILKFFAVGGVIEGTSKEEASVGGVLRTMRVNALALTHANEDADLPPFEVVGGSA